MTNTKIIEAVRPELLTSLDDRVRIRVLPPLILCIGLLIGVFYLAFNHIQSKGVSDVRHLTAKRVQDLLHDELQDEIAIMSASLEAIVRDEGIRDALKDRDRDALLAQSKTLFDELRRKYSITHLYFHDPARVNILRVHRLELQGDKIDRLSALEAERTGKPASALEQGPTGNCTLRVVYPWFDNGKLLGYVEMGTEFEAVAKKVHEILNVDVLVIVDKKYLNRDQWEQRNKKDGRQSAWDDFPNSVVIDKTVDVIPEPIQDYLKQPVRVGSGPTAIASADGKVEEIIFMPLRDVGPREMGDLIVFYDVTAASNQARNWLFTVTLICAGIGTVLTLGFYLFLGKVERDLRRRAARLANANVELQSEVIQRRQIEQARGAAEAETLEANRKLQEALASLRQTQNQLVQQERLRALGTMASGIAHDFNNSLTAVLGYSELLLARPESLHGDHKLEKYLKGINTAASDASHVVARLREFYRNREEGEVTAAVAINPLLEQVISMTEPRWKNQMLSSGITIRMNLDLADVPKIDGDAPQLREAFINLVLNSADAMHENGVITLRTRHEGPSVVIEVADTGSGMTEEVKRRCLEPFFTTKGERGTGLGLSMVFGIVQRHEGTIEIDSEIGKGTTFRIKLPAMLEQPDSSRHELSSLKQYHLNVLVADDEEMVREVLREYLTGFGHTVTEASDGLEALGKFRRESFDLVITDRGMPRMNGDQLAAEIKAHSPAVPVILLSGFGALMNAQSQIPRGVDMVLSKPIRIEALRQALEKIIQEFKIPSGGFQRMAEV